MKDDEVIQICQGDSVFIGGKYVKSSTTITNQLVSSLGCEYVQKIEVVVIPYQQTKVYKNICIGDSIFIRNHWFKERGEFEILIPNINKCDSLIRIFIQSFQDIETFDTMELCRGDTLQVFGIEVTFESNYTNTFLSAMG